MPSDRVWTVSSLLEYLSSHDSWLGIENITVDSSLSPNPLADRLQRITAELKDKRSSLHLMEREIFSLENQKIELEEQLREDRLRSEVKLVHLLKDKGTREERLRKDAEAKLKEQYPEIERLQASLATESRLKNEVVAVEHSLRKEISQYEEKTVNDEKTIIRQSEQERQLRQEVERLQMKVSLDNDKIRALQESEITLQGELERLRRRLDDALTQLPPPESYPVVGIELSEARQYGVDGVCVVAVKDNASAANAGILEGDIITSLNNQQVREREDFKHIVRSCAPGQHVPFILFRGQHPNRQKLMGKMEVAGAAAFPDVKRTIVRRSTSPRTRSPSPTMHMNEFTSSSSVSVTHSLSSPTTRNHSPPLIFFPHRGAA
eukprot:TRINITY_DN114604_c0_g1_i1.p1 TRINITY_DN114604_c0_g1~~TRINITY_DN114604_c0_g1_i1.p1  ORF type:complete len:378 (-),score=27.95 TRINITY_DN114604_c0_g1_i1:104-1237(-)